MANSTGEEPAKGSVEAVAAKVLPAVVSIEAYGQSGAAEAAFVGQGGAGLRVVAGSTKHNAEDLAIGLDQRPARGALAWGVVWEGPFAEFVRECARDLGLPATASDDVIRGNLRLIASFVA